VVLTLILTLLSSGVAVVFGCHGTKSVIENNAAKFHHCDACHAEQQRVTDLWQRIGIVSVAGALERNGK